MDKAFFALLLLVLQNTSKTLLLRFAVGGRKPQFLYSAAVLGTEGLKCTLSVLWVLRSGGSTRSIVHFVRSEWRMFLRVMVPAAVYNCQQVLEFVALSKLEAHVFSVLVQTKLLTTALFSWLVLRKRLHDAKRRSQGCARLAAAESKRQEKQEAAHDQYMNTCDLVKGS